ncbi:hypothetical protein PHYPSEUDO_011123 [Phytophthora pseudosyringae]|uniref:Myb-like domain-containing protein n=1 Tax=Phytophthora pseudosyringae TaxID=221518 RepID=A0A8T1V9S8_9STRA|nr:hypothetical protein PHYPSEUDO_011123 [Phytophthora pseudosyringae]
MATSGSDAAAAAEPAELQGEPRWSSIRYAPHPRPAQWSRATDEKLMLLVTQSTASGERFPVGVNWLEVSRVVRRSPVDCVKRYAFLHDAREQYNALQGEHQVEVKTEGDEEAGGLQEELEGALLDSEDEYLEEQSSLSDFATPVASPKLQSLDTSGEFVRSGPVSPGSPPPFAVARPAAARLPGTAVSGGSPFRWESLVNDPNYTAPVLNSPPNLRHKQSFQGRFGLEDDEAKVLSSASSPRLSPRGPMSPPRSQGQIGEMGADPNYSASVLTHAFKGLKLGAMPLGSPPLGSPLIGSPRLSRKISNSEYPFLKEEDMLSARQSAASSGFRGIGGTEARAAAAPFLNDAYGSGDPTAGDLQRQMNAHLMRMSAMSAMSSFHGDNPFSNSVTQSALEDAFLDMAGSRLDASSVLLSSRMSATPGSQSQMRLEQIQALGHERQRAQDAASKTPE